MDKQLLYQVIYDQQQDFLEIKDLIRREKVNELKKLLKLKLPIIITGVRRCGKSSLLKIIFDDLKLEEKDYLYINFNDERLISFENENFQDILDYLGENNYHDKVYFFLDEIQEVKNWEKWVDRIKDKFQILITGSNSKLLSEEISSVLTGRSINLSLFPFSFSEYLTYKEIEIKDYNLDRKLQNKIKWEFKNYLLSGGFPKMVIENENILLKELYENILYRDIIRRFNSKSTKQIKEISIYLLSNVSSDLSLRTLSKVSGIKNLGILGDILETFEKSFLFFTTNKFDYSIKKQIQNPKKVYCIDLGLPNKLGFKFSKNDGKLLENFVAISLKQKGKEIYYHRGKNECDFVIKDKNKIVEAIQVCYNFNEENREREVKGLIEAMKKFKLKSGKIITMNEEETIKKEGFTIKVIPAYKWFLSL